MEIQEIIKYEGNKDTLIYKFPKEDFNTITGNIFKKHDELGVG